MKSILIITFGLCSVGTLVAQSSFVQSTQNSNVKFYSGNEGNFFNNSVNQTGGYFVPKDSLVSSFFSMGLMIAGHDVNGQIKGAIADINDSDFKYGPIATIYLDTNYTNRYANHLWEVYRSEIEYHIAHWQDQNYSLPANIENWPGNGNVSNGESQRLAPFFDVDADQNYEPMEGDYPIIRGDKAMYVIFNDHGLHPSGLEPILMEVHVMFYQFNQPANQMLNNTVFMHTTVYNRGTQTIYDPYIGHYTDFDLGGYSDDFVAVNPDKNLAYVFNGDLYDEATGGNPGFGENPPAVGVVALDRNMTSETPVLSQSNGSIEIYNTLQGLQNDGSPFLDNSGNPTMFVYSEVDSTWAADSIGTAPLGDRRCIIGYHMGTLGYQGSFCLNNAIVYARSEEGYLFASADSLFQVTDYIQNFFDSQIWGCEYGGLSLKESNELSFRLYPNPASNLLFLEGISEGDFTIFSTDGKAILNGSSNGSIDVQELESGYYLLVLQSENKKGTQRFIKQ